MAMIRRSRLALPLALALIIAACSSGAGDPVATPLPVPSEAASPETSGAPPASDPGTAAAPSDATPSTPVLDQAWATAELTDVSTGTTFRIADLAGRVVILETMAIWCTNCRRQQVDVYTALEQLDPDEVAYVVVDVDPNESDSSLKEYRERNGFTGTYAVAARDMARSLADDFGDQVLNPPSTPMILVGRDGRVTLTDYGHKSPDEIVALARDHGA